MLRPDTMALTALLALLTAIGPLSMDLYLPSMPHIARLLDVPIAQVQLTIASYLLGYAVGQIVYGPVSDRMGRKPVLFAALVIYCAASLACSAAYSIETLIFGRFLQAVGGSGVIVLARAVVRDLYSGARAGRELSLMGAIMALAPLIAPIIGGVLQTAFGWRAAFVSLLGFGVLLSLAVWQLLPETLQQRSTGPVSLASIMRGYRDFLAHRAFVGNLGILTMSYAGLLVWVSSASYVLQDLYGLSAIGFGVAFAISTSGYLFGTAWAARLVMRIGIDSTIGIGAAALAGGSLIMVAVVALHLKSPASLVLSFALYICGLGLAMPQSIAAALTPFPDRAGSASSLLGFVQQAFASALAAAIGFMLGASAWPMAAAIAVMGCATLAIWLVSRAARRDTAEL
jgi:MFS transporter, DHA1 family, multidrug resistance protein